MKPINTDERKSSFFIFLIFFIVTVFLIVMAVFYGMQVPAKQNELMKSQLANFKKEQDFLSGFEGRVSKIKEELDLINEKKDADVIDSHIGNLLDTLDRQIGTSSNPKIYDDISWSLHSLREAKTDLRQKHTSDKQQTDCESQLQNAKNEAISLTNQNLILTQQVQQLQQQQQHR